MTAAFILITGSGLGKTKIGDALQSQYALRGKLVKRVSWDEGNVDETELEHLSRFPGFVIVEAPTAEVPFEPWQTISIEGGQPLGHLQRI